MFIVRSFPGVKLDCLSHHAIPAVKNNPDRIVIRCGTSNRIMDESPEATAEKTIELGKNARSTTNNAVISSIIRRRDKLADKGSRVNSIVENFCNQD